ncbi:MAG: long-chain fatty acid--CoA ligase [Acidobacteriota bacterium]|nr:long-chain fatty acid--CoA ligase [Acidobacteriota bacterium]
MQSLAGLLLNTLASYPKDDFMLYKKDGAYAPLSTETFGTRVRHMALGLRNLGLGKEDKLVILAENRPEWTISDFATLCNGALTVPIYTTLVPDQIAYIIDDSDAKIVVVSDAVQWAKIEAIRARLDKVKHFITFADKAPDGVLTLEAVMAEGRRIDAAEPGLFKEMALAVKGEDEASLIYTSGTTGVPKGVILTHGNFLSNVTTAATLLEFSNRDVVLSFLPLSHVLERMVTFAYVYRGCSIAYAESVEAVAQNLLEVRPNIMVSVPRVFEKIYARVMDAVLAGSGVKRKIFFWAIKTGKAHSARTLAGRPVSGPLKFKRKLAHKLVFAKVVARTGGRVRFFVSGGAPLSKDIAEFFHAIGLYIMEGYGLTETSPVVSCNTFERLRFGTVGHPIPGVEVKIAPDGEILTKGPNIMKGYYKKEAETREVFDGEWFKTGDIGHIDPDGYLVITDRKKDLIVTSGGKNIAPQPIENLLKTLPLVTGAVMIGDRKRFVSALIVPDYEKLEAFAQAGGIVFKDRADLVKNEKVVSHVMSEIERAVSVLAPYERIKKITLLEKDFEIGEGEITPTLKVRRKAIEKKYGELIEAMYTDETGDAPIG